ncbi:MAG: D-alanyl-D-alanine carboxypeptidase [Treponema sp.]|nr:D-alanyl-D-alanine carboxypeptidase [Treponema sp.]
MSGKIKSKKIIIGIISFVVLCAGSFCLLTGIRAKQFSDIQIPSLLSATEQIELDELLKKQYPQNYGLLKNLPYLVSEPDLKVYAESSILIDVSNGFVLYENNADEVIPPASMTKLFAMFVIEEEVSNGSISYEDYIPLPAECWACNMPPHSSLMFLGEGQKVTLEELLLGLSICSGNDAAYALAYSVCGSMENLVSRMNEVAQSLGLTHTHFVESSGYSELNTTTAREMAAFCAYYIKKHPDSLHRFHSVLSFTYPKKQNLADGDKPAAQDFSNGIPRHITMAITQTNTNPLLGKLDGCDGLKTGFIDESGYNLALTTVRNGTRFLSVTMKGPGKNAEQGQSGRVHDGTLLMEWAHSSFADYSMEMTVHPYNIKAFGSDQKMLRIVPVYSEKTIAIPFTLSADRQQNLDAVKVYVELPDYTFGAVTEGQILGKILVYIDNYLLKEIPLVADRNLNSINLFSTLSDKILAKAFQMKLHAGE